jgi:hypothetical protein
VKARRFFESVYADDAARKASERRAKGRDLLLYARNRALTPLERTLTAFHRRRDLPIVFIVGAPRSGTTLTFQLAARHLEVGYPTNAMARYFGAPVVGVHRHRREHAARRARDIPLESHFGRAEGRLSPHEFSWFWHYHLPPHASDSEPLDLGPVKSPLLGMAGAFASPLLMKSINYTSYRVASLRALLPDARFVWVRRDRISTALSILAAREARYGDARVWWSIRPAISAELAGESPEAQVAGQIVDVEESIGRSFAALPPTAAMTIRYEELTGAPEGTVRRLADFVGVALREAPLLRATALRESRRSDGDPSREARVSTLSRLFSSVAHSP